MSLKSFDSNGMEFNFIFDHSTFLVPLPMFLPPSGINASLGEMFRSVALKTKTLWYFPMSDFV